MLKSDTPLVKENVILFTQNFGLTIVVLITIDVCLILVLNLAVNVDLSVKTVFIFLWNVLYMIILDKNKYL
jgi:hypothetical protein